MAWDANVCPYCGRDYRPQAMAPSAAKRDSGSPVAAGVLILLGSLVYIVLGGIVAAGSTIAEEWTSGDSAWGVACGLVGLALGIISLLGGIFAIQKKYWALALIGGILTIPTILGLIGLILVAISRDAFES
jgi:hypothetical protein